MKTSSTSRSVSHSWRFRLLVMLTLLMYVSSSVGVLVGQGGMPGCRCAQGDPGPNGCCCRARLQTIEAELAAQPACCASASGNNIPVDSEPADSEPVACGAESSQQTGSLSSDCCSIIPTPVSGCCSTGSTSSPSSSGSGCCGTADPAALPGLYAMCRCGSQHPSGLICNSDPRLLTQESGLNGSEHNTALPPNVFSAYVPPLLLLESPPPQPQLV